MSYILSNIKHSPLEDLNYSYISSYYGNRYFYNPLSGKYVSDFHNGIDMTSGSNIVAAYDGIVIECRNNINGYSEKYASGNYVLLKHDNSLYTIYAHMKYGSVIVNVGEKVKKGQIIGKMGSTGFVTGAHLHYGVKENGIWVDPIPFLLETNNNDVVIEEDDKEEIVYVIKYGDTLTKIANEFGVTVDYLVKLNNIKNPNLIYAGEKLIIKKNKENKIYIVQAGDNLSLIAKKYNTTWQELYEKNKKVIGNDPNLIYPGQRLVI